MTGYYTPQNAYDFTSSYKKESINDRKDSVIELLGADDWKQVKETFNNDPVEGIQQELDYMFPDEDNYNFATEIFKLLRGR